jgi:hypothetical protein
MDLIALEEIRRTKYHCSTRDVADLRSVRRKPVVEGMISEYVCHERGEELDVGRAS